VDSHSEGAPAAISLALRHPEVPALSPAGRGIGVRDVRTSAVRRRNATHRSRKGDNKAASAEIMSDLSFPAFTFIKLDLAIDNIRNVSATTQKLHYFFSFACEPRPIGIRVRVLLQPATSGLRTRSPPRAIGTGWFAGLGNSVRKRSLLLHRRPEPGAI